MEKQDDQTLLQEVIYKPTTETKAPTPLKPENLKSGTFLYFAVSIANLVAFTAGVAFGWTSPVLPKLNGKVEPENNPLGRSITSNEESWIAGLICLGAIFGPLIAGPIADKMGRKKTLLLAACPMAVSLVLAAYAQTVSLLYFSRLLIGLGAGSGFTILPMYLAEISEDHNRGTIGCSMGAFIASGLLFSFTVGPFLTIRNFCLACCIPLLVFLTVFPWCIPETPQFLASVNRNKDLETSLKKLRAKSVSEIQKEVNEINKRVFEEKKIKSGVTDLFRFKGLRRGLVVALGIMILQQFAGINAVLAYMQTIFDATGSGWKPEISTIVIGIIQMLTTVLTSFLADRLGRRILLLTSSIGSCVSLLTLGFYFYRKNNDFDVGNISWLPVTSLVVFMVAFNVGLGPLPWAVMAELFPPNVKSAASTICSCSCFTAAFVITLLFPILSDVLGMANSFWFFALMCLIGTFFMYWMLPETKGKSLQEIQQLLEGS